MELSSWTLVVDFIFGVRREMVEKLRVHLSAPNWKQTNKHTKNMHAMEEVAAFTKQRKRMEKVTGGKAGSPEADEYE